MIGWNYIVLFLCIAFAAFLVWKEVSRANRARLFGRVMASIIAMACLLCLIRPMHINVRQTRVSSGRELIWLTAGYQQDSLEKFLESTKGNFAVYTSDQNTLRAARSIPAVFMAAPVLLADSLDSLKSLHVFGYGFTKDELKETGKLPITFHATPLPEGISAIHWVSTIRQGEPLLIQGNFNNTRSIPAKLLLQGLQTNLDSVLVPAGRQQVFELKCVPKHRGRAVYSLYSLAGKDTLATEAVPMEVTESGSLKILMLASSPDFEQKFLKTWLYDNRYPLAIRTTISRNKYHKEFLNSNEVSLNRVTNALLEKFNLLISDAQALTDMPADELSIIRSRVEEHGLGLIIKADSFTRPGAFYAKQFPLFRGTGDGRRKWLLQWQPDSVRVNSPGITSPVFIRYLPGTQPLVVDEKSQVYGSAGIYGVGRIVATTLTNTFTWKLAGNDSAYHSFWSMLLQKAAPAAREDHHWLMEPHLPRVNEPVRLTLQSTTTALPRVKAGNSAIYFRQNAWLPTEWEGIYWPRQTGWLNIQLDSSQDWLYVYESTAWKAVYATAEYLQTKNHAKMYNGLISKTKHNTNSTIPLNVPKIFFFIAVIVSAGYLWWEKKFSSVY